MDNKAIRKIQQSDIQEWLSNNKEIASYYIGDEYIVAHFEELKTENTPLCFTSNCFMLCLEGEFEFEINLSRHKMQANDLIFMMSAHVLEIRNVSNNFKGEFLFIKSHFLGIHQLFSQILTIRNCLIKQPVLHLSEQEVLRIRRLFSSILDIPEEQAGPFRNKISEHLSVAMIYEIITLYQSRGANQSKDKLSRNDEILNRFALLLSEHIQKERSVKFYADKLNLSPKYFSSLIKEVTGRTTTDIISSITIIRAKMLLSKSNMNVQQVANELNFPDQSTFGKFFKRETGISPSQFIWRE